MDERLKRPELEKGLRIDETRPLGKEPVMGEFGNAKELIGKLVEEEGEGPHREMDEEIQKSYR